MVFVVVEQKEPHAGRMAFADVAQPATFAQRCALARRLRDELEVPLPIFVDGMDDASRALFSDLPSPAFVLDREGRVVDKLPWADPEPLRRTLRELLRHDAEPAADPGAPTPLTQRVAVAARLLAHGDRRTALAWLTATAAPSEPAAPSPETLAAAATLRVLALAEATEPVRDDAVAAAREAIAAAFAGEPGQALAARIRLAEAAGGLPGAAALWREALAALEPRAPEQTRTWLEQRAAAAAR